MSLILYIDGGARGNPGPAGAGVSIRDEAGATLFEAAYYLGTQTNNAAEYLALIRALQRVGNQTGSRITILSDSELLVRQLTGEYRVKSPKLMQYHEQVQMLLLRMGGWSVRHIPRELNRRADELANLAMDRRCDVIVFDAERGGSRPEQPETTGETPISPATGDPLAAEIDSSASGSAESTFSKPLIDPAARTAQAARVTVVRNPKEGVCPARTCCPPAFTIENVLPAGLCVHAAHALLPTILAVLNTDPSEFAAIPTMTVRCMKSECGALFHVSPQRGANGVSHSDKS